MPEELNNASSLRVFKYKFREWKLTNCPFRLCMTYIQHIGFIYLSNPSAKNNIFDNIPRSKTLILELIPPKKIKTYFDNLLLKFIK